MPHFLDIRVNGIAPLLSVKASKNFVLLRVVASRPARGDRGGVRYGFNRVGGAIITKGCCVVKNKGETRFSLLMGLTNPHRIRAPTVAPLLRQEVIKEGGGVLQRRLVLMQEK